MKKYFVLITIIIFASCNKTKQLSETDKKIEALIKQMTLEEKIGQMTQLCFSTITLNGSKNLDLNVDNFKESILKYHVGSFLSGSDSKGKWVKFITEIQKVAINETRLHIPLIIGIDHVHGANYVNEGTILPHNLTLSCSFDPEILKAGATVTAVETADLGLSWNFAPVLDIGKNAYWPRLYETFGEDPLVCSVLGTSFIKAYQNCESVLPYKLAACGKHFIGYSDPKSGWDRTPSEIPDQILYEQFIPSFKAAIDAGVKSIMVNSGEVNGEPVHGSKRLLTGLLREKLGFEGVILTDIKDIKKIVEMHAGAKDEKEATLMAINAGIDMSMACNAYDFCTIVNELVKEGKITEERINQSVRRILKLKYELGLFENPYPRSDRLNVFKNKEHLAVAKKAASESIVLLKNKGVLPLDKSKKILITGFAAHSKKMLNGAWTFEWLGAEEARQPKETKTIYSALKSEFDSTKISLFQTDGITNESEKKSFLKVAATSEIIIITAGEKPYSEFKGNISDLTLEKSQLELIKVAKSTGKPVVLILIEGRPRIISEIADTMDAIIFTGYPGMMGGEALAEILSGKINPCGKLSFTYQKEVGHCLPYYYKASEKYNPLFPFGSGLSYSTFEYSDLRLSDSIIKSPNQEITASIYIRNLSKQNAKEIVLWYVNQSYGTITRPVKQLKHFEKIDISAGIRNKLIFKFKSSLFSYPDEKGNLILDKGKYTIIVNDQTKNIYIQ